MPLYEYECDACGHRFEQIQKFSDPPVETCPKCGSKVHKLVSSPAFQFKGTGWYVTDYAKKDGGGKSDKSDKAEKSDKSEKSSESTSSESKSETKSNSKSDSKTDSAKSS